MPSFWDLYPVLSPFTCASRSTGTASASIKKKKKKRQEEGKKNPQSLLLMWEVSAPPEGLWEAEHAHLETNFGSLPSLKDNVGSWAVYHLCHPVDVWEVMVVRISSVSSSLCVLWNNRTISPPLSVWVCLCLCTKVENCLGLPSV